MVSLFSVKQFGGNIYFSNEAIFGFYNLFIMSR